MYIVFEKLKSNSSHVRYSTHIPDPSVFNLKDWVAPIGERLVNFVNNADYSKSEFLKYFTPDKEKIELIRDELKLDLSAVAGKPLFTNNSNRFFLPLEEVTADKKLEQYNPIMFKTFYQFSSDKQLKIFKSRQVFLVDSLRAALAIELLKYAEEAPKKTSQHLKICPSCERFFITTHRADEKYCSEKCVAIKLKNDMQNPFFAKYKQLYQNIRRTIELDEKEIYTEWLNIAKAEHKNAKKYIDADDYRNQMRALWNEKRAKNG